MVHETHAKTLPAEIGAPAFVDGWRTCALIVGAVFSVIAADWPLLMKSIDHVLRAWLLGLMLTFGFSVGGLALLMVQYCSGGKWGLLLRRPLEAMSRTLPLVFVYWVVVAFSLNKLYLWAAVSDVDAALKSGWINEVQAHAIEFKRPMLNPTSFVVGESPVLCDLVVLYVAAEFVGPEARRGIGGDDPVLDQETGEHQRSGHRGLRHHNDCGRDLLGHVA